MLLRRALTDSLTAHFSRAPAQAAWKGAEARSQPLAPWNSEAYIPRGKGPTDREPGRERPRPKEGMRPKNKKISICRKKRRRTFPD